MATNCKVVIIANEPLHYQLPLPSQTDAVFAWLVREDVQQWGGLVINGFV